MLDSVVLKKMKIAFRAAISVADFWQLFLGDLGYYDESGHIFITDRIKDVMFCETMQVCETHKIGKQMVS